MKINIGQLVCGKVINTCNTWLGIEGKYTIIQVDKIHSNGDVSNKNWDDTFIRLDKDNLVLTSSYIWHLKCQEQQDSEYNTWPIYYPILSKKDFNSIKKYYETAEYFKNRLEKDEG